MLLKRDIYILLCWVPEGSLAGIFQRRPDLSPTLPNLLFLRAGPEVDELLGLAMLEEAFGAGDA